MRVKIFPSKAQGTVSAPPSKSIAHRYLICAALCEGESVVRNLAYSKDIEATINCLRALGAEIRLNGNTAYVKGVDPKRISENTPELPCNESGSTLRFLIPLCLLSGEKHILKGSPYLLTRPLSVFEELAEKNGFVFEKTKDTLTVAGTLQSGAYTVRGDISSQFVSGLMFALPLLDGDSEIVVTLPLESGSYLDLTADALYRFGIDIGYFDYEPERKAYVCEVKGNQRYQPQDVTVEGDCSNAAFFQALNYAGGSVRVMGLDPDTSQGDRVFYQLFQTIKNNGIADLSDCPDLGPVAFAVAALLGKGMFTGTERLRLKESDRIEAMREELAKLGIEMAVSDNAVSIWGVLRPPREPLCGHNDHRIVMALSVLLTVTGGEIEGAEAVNKSFPDYFDRLKDLGVKIEYGMD